MLKRLWESVKLFFTWRRVYEAKLEELKVLEQELLLEQQMLLGQIFRDIPSANPDRKPELRN